MRVFSGTQGRADLSQTALSEPMARRFGVTCLCLLLTYKEAADIEVNHEDPGGTLIEVPDDKGQVTAKPFGDCSVDQMRRALQRLRKPASSKPLPPEAEALAEQYSEAVTGRFPKGARVKVLVRNQKGKAVLDFKGIPVGEKGRPSPYHGGGPRGGSSRGDAQCSERLTAMNETPLPMPDPGYARCVRCRHIFLLGMLRYVRHTAGRSRGELWVGRPHT